jgi:hypothetical protein
MQECIALFCAFTHYFAHSPGSYASSLSSRSLTVDVLMYKSRVSWINRKMCVPIDSDSHSDSDPGSCTHVCTPSRSSYTLSSAFEIRKLRRTYVCITTHMLDSACPAKGVTIIGAIKHCRLLQLYAGSVMSTRVHFTSARTLHTPATCGAVITADGDSADENSSCCSFCSWMILVSFSRAFLYAVRSKVQGFHKQWHRGSAA